MLWRDGAPVCVRGRVSGGAATSEAQLLSSLAGVLRAPIADAASRGAQLVRFICCFSTMQVMTHLSNAQYEPSFSDKTWLLGTGSLLAQPLAGADSGAGCLVLFSPAQSAFGAKTRAWVAALGAKLSSLDCAV